MPVPTTNTGYVDPAKVEAPVVETHDDLGYELDKPAAPVIPAPVVPPVEAAKVEEVKAATGYGKVEEVVPPVEAAKVEEKKPEDMTDEEKSAKEIVDVVKTLDAGYNKDKISKFALENKLTKAQLEAYVNMTKSEDAAFVKQQNEAKIAQRKSWKEDLMSDVEFGGENFDKNVDRIEKLLQNNMPNVKKMLTEQGGMLPPYFMKDLLSLSKALNPTTSLVSGEPSAPKESEGNFLEELYK